MSFPSLLCTLKGRLANWMMLVFPKPGLRGSHNNQYDFKMADGAGGAHLPEAPTICLHFLLSSTVSVLMGCVGSVSPGSLASGKFGVLYCSDFLRSLKEYFNFVCFFIIFMYMSILPACMFGPMCPQRRRRSWISEEQ